nr:MAG TPA: hypothetical protein [Caudoviricetes sp.]DAX84350.1 MAG TPA: hypothetical protein [Caudoviricetes sp.]
MYSYEIKQNFIKFYPVLLQKVSKKCPRKIF